MTTKWTVNGVEAPEGAEFYVGDRFCKKIRKMVLFFCPHAKGWKESRQDHESCKRVLDYQERPAQLSRIDIISQNGNSGEHYSDYAFCLSEAINKLKHCADVAPDDKRKDALLEIIDEVEFIKSEGDK